MEVFNIVYLGHDKIPPAEQNGTIKLIGDRGVQYLYNIREEEDVDFSKPPIKHGDDLVVAVKGPTRFLEDLAMDFDLFSGAYNDTLNIIWDFMDLFSAGFLLNERRIQSNDGTGEISVLLGLFANATVANLKVKLLNNSAGTDVYGGVVASNSKSDGPRCTSVLFAGMIPLSKSGVAVPLDSVLYVDISLRANGERYKASLSLNAKCTGESVAYDSSASPKFQVIVKWDAKEESVLSKYDSRTDCDQWSVIWFSQVSDNGV